MENESDVSTAPRREFAFGHRIQGRIAEMATVIQKAGYDVVQAGEADWRQALERARGHANQRVRQRFPDVNRREGVDLGGGRGATTGGISAGSTLSSMRAGSSAGSQLPPPSVLTSM